MSLKLSENKNKSNITPLPMIFVEKYMPKAPPAYATIYIYAFSQCCKGNTVITNGDIASHLHVLESDILRAWSYWQSVGILNYDETTGDLEILDLSNVSDVTKTAPTTITKSISTPSVIIEKRPTYSPEEISIYIDKSKDVKQLFASAQSHLGKLLSYNDMSTLFSFYDWLRLPMDVIEILLAYCTQNNHRSMNYIEKVAIDWAENGIITQQKAISRIKLYQQDYRDIMKALGQGDRAPTPVEETFLKKWLKEYNMSTQLIVLACEKTILGVGKPNFPYTDKIITSWHQKKVTTPEDIKRIEGEFAAAKKAKSVQNQPLQQQSRTTTPLKKNRFVNYEQREWDFDELEKLEREQNEREHPL